jgi:general stress protein 26
MSNSLQKLLFEKINETPNMMVGLNRNADLNEPMHICLDGQNTDKFWIFTFKDNRIADGGSSMANFSSADHKLFACFSGDLSEETDKSEVQSIFLHRLRHGIPMDS